MQFILRLIHKWYAQGAFREERIQTQDRRLKTHEKGLSSTQVWMTLLKTYFLNEMVMSSRVMSFILLLSYFSFFLSFFISFFLSFLPFSPFLYFLYCFRAKLLVMIAIMIIMKMISAAVIMAMTILMFCS